MANKQAFKGVYPSYLFKDHDPILDAIDTLIADSGWTFGEIAVGSGVTRTTLTNWQKRKVRRPQFATIKAVTRAVGGELRIIYKGKAI
jgi:transcriptional regulator with XRE-family HTH domain